MPGFAPLCYHTQVLPTSRPTWRPQQHAPTDIDVDMPQLPRGWIRKRMAFTRFLSFCLVKWHKNWWMWEKKLLNQKFLFKKSFRIYQQKSACQAWKKKLREIWLSWVSMINLREYIIQRVLYYYRIWFSIIKWIVVLVTSWVITTAQSAPG